MHTDRSRLYWALTIVAGLVVALVTWAFTRIDGLESCTPVDLPVVLAFEYARGPSDIAAIFGSDPCRSTLVAAFRAHSWLDILAYIPAFSTFHIVAALALRSKGPSLARAVIICALIAAFCDLSEDRILLGLLDAVSAGTGEPVAVSDWLYWFVSVKFALLALNAMLFGLLLMRGAMPDKAAGALAMLGGIIAMAGVTSRNLADLLALGIGAAWLAIFLIAIVSLLRSAHPQSPSAL